MRAVGDLSLRAVREIFHCGLCVGSFITACLMALLLMGSVVDCLFGMSEWCVNSFRSLPLYGAVGLRMQAACPGFLKGAC